MGDATRKTEVTKRWIYDLQSPTVGTEIAKTLNWAARDYEEQTKMKPVYNDTFHVMAYDDVIRIYWDEVLPNGN